MIHVEDSPLEEMPHMNLGVNNIVVGVDLSQASEIAVRYALTHYGKHETNFHFLNCYSLHPAWASDAATREKHHREISARYADFIHVSELISNYDLLKLHRLHLILLMSYIFLCSP